MSDVLKVVNVNKKFDKDYVLRNISFDLKEGEILGLVGPNGAGKTTLMRIIVGLIKKHGGDIFFCVDKNKIKRDEKLLGCMIETPKFYSYMNAYQNLKFFSGLSGKVDRKEINNMLSFVGLSGETKKKVKKYSLGMKQRLGMALAFLNHPKILILDEPTNGIDPDGIKKIRDYLKKLAESDINLQVKNVQEIYLDYYIINSNVFHLNIESCICNLDMTPMEKWTQYDTQMYERIYQGLISACLSNRAILPNCSWQ